MKPALYFEDDGADRSLGAQRGGGRERKGLAVGTDEEKKAERGLG